MAFIEFSATSPNFHLIIHKILPTIFAALIVDCIVLGNFGIFGAGGNNGNSISKLGINDGSSGNVGGDGIRGIFHKLIDDNKLRSTHLICSTISIPNSTESSKFKVKSILGGSGRFGNSGKGTATGLNVKLGSFISVSICISEKSK